MQNNATPRVTQNVDAESDKTTEEGCNFMNSDSESEFAARVVDGIYRPAVQMHPVAAAVKKLKVLDAPTGKKRCI